MSVRGGRAFGGGAPAVALLAVVLLLAPSLPIAVAQSPVDPWWGPTDVASPTQGWAVRVPVVVENNRTFFLHDQTVAVDVDFGALLVAAGWTNRTAGSEATLRGFTLDVDSIRVVEYGIGFAGGPIDGPATRPLPHLFYPAPLGSTHRRDFDAERNPSGTVLFFMHGALAAGQKRYFYVYANPLQYAKTPAQADTLAERAPLDAFLYASTGNVYYGYEPNQLGRAHQLHIAPLTFERTNVQVDSYALGRYVPLAATDDQANPFVLPSSNPFPPPDRTFFVPGGTKYRVTADHPILVTATGPRDASNALTESFGYVPATNGSFAGHEFYLFGGLGSAGVAAGPVDPTGNGPSDAAGVPSAVTVYRAAGATGNIRILVNNRDPVTMSSVELVRSVPVALDQWNYIRTTGGDVLLSTGPALPRDGPFPPQTIPALTGATVGDDFITALPTDGGWLRICAASSTALRVVDANHPNTQVPFLIRGEATPSGPIETTPPLRIEPSLGCTTLNATAATPSGLLELYSVKAAPTATPAPFRLTAGSGARQVSGNLRYPSGNLGGDAGTSVYASGITGVFAYYNDTRVSVSYERLKNNQLLAFNGTPFALGEDGFQVIDPSTVPDATGRYLVTSTKPMGVVAIADPYNDGYQHTLPGRPFPLRTTIGHAEFRGPLIELRSREKDGRQDFRSTGPGTAVTFPLEVANLGRWLGGADLTDEITISCVGPTGWDVGGCGRTVRLGSRQAERVDVAITPPQDALNVNGTFQVTARSRSGITSEFKLIVFVEIRYGIGLWFDVEGGRKTIDPPIGVDPGGTYTYNIVAKNTGSAPDTFDLTVTPDARPGWTQALTLDGEARRSIALDAGESKVLRFEVTAPNAETAQQNLVSIRAQSQASALAGDVVNTATRIRPKISIHLTLDPLTQIAEPNATATFNLTVNNSGNDNFDILLSQEGLLPRGWNASLGARDFILPPGTNLTVALRVSPPLDARAGDLATLKVKAEVDAGTGGQTIPGDQVSAVVVVRKVHNLTVPSLNDAVARPGEALRFVLPLTNHGNGNDVIELLPGAVTPAWRLESETSALALDVGGSDDLPLIIHVPPLTPPGTYNLTFTVRLSREATTNLTIPIGVVEAAVVKLSGLPSDLDLAPGRARTVQVTAANTGNVAGTFSFDATVPPGWTATFSPPQARLSPGDVVPVSVRLNASRAATDGAYGLSLAASLAGKPAGSAATANATLARPQLYLAKVEGTGTVASGELVLVSASVGNRGGIAAENVSVELLVDGRSVDQVTLARIGVGDEKIATLHWLATKRTSDIRVVLDPHQDIVEAARDQHDATVAFGSRLPIPAPSAILVLAGLALVATLVGRRRA